MRIALLLALLAACSADHGDPTPGDEQSAFAQFENIVVAPVTVGGASGFAYIDTGNPQGELDDVTFPDLTALPSAGGDVAVTVGGTTIGSAFIFDTYVFDIADTSAFQISGNLGCSVTCGQVAHFDYQNDKFTLGAAPPPAGIGSDIAVPFTFEGGMLDDLPPSRVVVPVVVDGTTYSLMLDTGATNITIGAPEYAALTSDGRKKLDSTVTTETGTSTSSLTRAHVVTLGGIEIDGALVAHADSFDDVLAQVSQDTGTTIDGSLGGSFLSSFYVTIDYPAGVVHFARYTDASHRVDPAVNVGITISAVTDDGYTVGAVAGDAAAQGVAVGDLVVGVAGHDARAYGPYSTLVAMSGSAGAQVEVELSDGRVLELTVGDLLAP